VRSAGSSAVGAPSTTGSSALGLFRRDEPLHVKLAREGGLELSESESSAPPWDAAGIHGIHRAREWDVVTTVSAPDLPGDRIEFVAIAPGEVACDGDPGPLPEAVDRELKRPYRAEAVARDGGLWAVAARRIEVVRLPGVTGEEIELTSYGGERTLLVDGAREFGSIPALERPEHVVRARRIADDAFEVETAPL
jgi:hypothetical protein